MRPYGLASLEQGVAFTPNHVVRHTYPEGREFLAITATLMERDGLLRLDDPVRIGDVGVGECLPGSGVTFIPARAAISRSGMGLMAAEATPPTLLARRTPPSPALTFGKSATHPRNAGVVCQRGRPFPNDHP